MMGWGWGWGHGMGVGMGITWLLTLVVIGLVTYLVVRAARHDEPADRHSPGPRPIARPTAAEILAERYARGEIDTAEYEERISRLA